jgi:hypothetical protein
VAPRPTSVGRCGPKLQLTWQRVDVHSALYLDLELVCRCTRSSGYRQRPPSPPQERLRTRRWGQLFGAALDYLELFTLQSTVSPQEVQELKVSERPPSTLRNIDGGAPGGAGAGGPGAPTINAKKYRRRASRRCRSWRSGSDHHQR